MCSQVEFDGAQIVSHMCMCIEYLIHVSKECARDFPVGMVMLRQTRRCY